MNAARFVVWASKGSDEIDDDGTRVNEESNGMDSASDIGTRVQTQALGRGGMSGSNSIKNRKAGEIAGRVLVSITTPV